jgi:2-oxoisovalerate dehydrogenase E1 component
MPTSTLNITTLEQLYRRMLEIRRFEEALLARYEAGNMSGTTHTCIGQESVPVAALAHLGPVDLVVSNHRGHGHFLAAGGDARSLFLEILGDRGGVCQGLGGSQHLHRENFYSHGVLGGTAALAVGLALGQKRRAERGLVICFLGDGALGEGIVYESFNIASLWKLPILFVIENNGYAQTTPIALNLAGTVAGRPQAFGIDTVASESTDVVGLHAAFEHAFRHVRETGTPFCQVVRCYRFSPHSKGDDQRDPAEIAEWKARDPLVLAAEGLSPAVSDLVGAEVERQTREAFVPPAMVDAPSRDLLDSDDRLLPVAFEPAAGLRTSAGRETMVSHLRDVFHGLMERRRTMYLLGQDILDPYGGAFKVYAGLSTHYPERVLTTPVSEAAMVGLAAGFALRGFRPVVEIMFGDFLMLASDQLLNYATKFARMYRGASCPVIVRTPMGGGRGYGPTHSQSIEKHFFGMPGLLVIANDPIHDQRFIWERMLDAGCPCLYVESKVLYGTSLPTMENGRLLGMSVRSTHSFFPTARLTFAPEGEAADAAIVAYGGMALAAIEAARTLFEAHELIVDVVVPSQLAPVPISDLLASTAGTRVTTVVEEGTRRWGYGAEVLACLAEHAGPGGPRLVRVAAPDTIVPNSAAAEKQVLPGEAEIVAALAGALR